MMRDLLMAGLVAGMVTLALVGFARGTEVATLREVNALRSVCEQAALHETPLPELMTRFESRYRLLLRDRDGTSVLWVRDLQEPTVWRPRAAAVLHFKQGILHQWHVYEDGIHF
jgi:hypothetical protein